MFTLTERPIAVQPLIETLRDPQVGALATFEGWVRNHNHDRAVLSLEYQVYPELALLEGQKIIAEALERFPLRQALAVHRWGHLQVGDGAVWVGATASHRQAAFDGAEYIINELKRRLPIWKKEHYQDGGTEWVYCRH
jgi:molybdopterin synthase catalytic subunit